MVLPTLSCDLCVCVCVCVCAHVPLREMPSQLAWGPLSPFWPVLACPTTPGPWSQPPCSGFWNDESKSEPRPSLCRACHTQVCSTEYGDTDISWYLAIFVPSPALGMDLRCWETNGTFEGNSLLNPGLH